MTRIYGALPPGEFAWQIRKTATSIKFANDAQRFIEQNPDHAGVKVLEQAIKDGKLVLPNWTTLEEYIKQNQAV